MSNIHEALKKAQKDRDVRNLEYSGILAASRRKRRRLGWKAVGWLFPLMIVILLAFFYDSWLNFRGLQTPNPAENEHQRFQPVHDGTVPDMSKEISPGKPRTLRPGESRTVASGRPQGVEIGERPISNSGPPQAIKPGPPQGMDQGRPPAIKPGEAKSTVSNKPEETYERARRFHTEGRLEEAKRLYEETLQLDPGHVDTLNNLGVIYMRKKDYLAAERNLEKAVRLKPRYAEPFYNLACLKAITGDTKRALAYLQKAFSLDPTVRDWAQKDADLETLRQLPEFKELI
jgi:tetratricopeptide (TPR) repeat protein